MLGNEALEDKRVSLVVDCIKSLCEYRGIGFNKKILFPSDREFFVFFSERVRSVFLSYIKKAHSFIWRETRVKINDSYGLEITICGKEIKTVEDFNNAFESARIIID